MKKKSSGKTITVTLTASEAWVIFTGLSQGLGNPLDEHPKDRRMCKAIRSMREWFATLAGEAGCNGDHDLDLSDIPHMISQKEWNRILACYGKK